jgi:hypothetical protein
MYFSRGYLSTRTSTLYLGLRYARQSIDFPVLYPKLSATSNAITAVHTHYYVRLSALRLLVSVHIHVYKIQFKILRLVIHHNVIS